MSDASEHQRQVETIEAGLARQTRVIATALTLLVVIAALCLALLLGHILELPWLTHSH